jgi:hypothetical protein
MNQEPFRSASDDVRVIDAPWTGFAVFCGYTAIAVAAAAIGMVRRDA